MASEANEPGSESGKRSDDRRGVPEGTPQEGGASTPLAAPGSFAAAGMRYPDRRLVPRRALVLVGGVFVGEALSVIGQVISFKLRRKRIFRMAPVHHHFELLGWPEPQIIVRFWIVSVVCALLALSTLKLR